ncbi:hypothetical protein CHISP_1706 [Chitinispirillum alkaliphilum]|nr:hypothetical protein CHISP_1706 [Chitinispirillum alkaliphilum]
MAQITHSVLRVNKKEVFDMMLNQSESIVVIRNDKAISYPVNNRFHPDKKYPELTVNETDSSNKVYGMLRDLLIDLRLDSKNINTSKWNPFAEFINPGMNVFIKPNTVAHEHPGKKDLFSIIVHPSVVRPVLDYVCLALRGKGTITIGDSQIYYSDFDKMLLNSGLGELLNWYKNQTTIPITCFDLRLDRAKRSYLYGRWDREKIEHDPLGYQNVDVGEYSRFVGMDSSRLRIAVASYKKTVKYHSDGRHEYVIPRSFLKADAVINIAKLKTHRRTAITLGLKNYMGIPACKACVPHYITGSSIEGGDQYIYPSFRKRIATFLHDTIQSSRYMPVKLVCAVTKKLLWNTHRIIPFKDKVYEAMWYGNDTLWRTLADLNRIVMYADKEGRIRDTVQRKQLVIVDGIVGGEGNGPLVCDPVKSGTMIAGFSPVAVDTVAATAMGFDCTKIPLISKSFDISCSDIPLFRGKSEDLHLFHNGLKMDLKQFGTNFNLNFKAHPQWEGHV